MSTSPHGTAERIAALSKRIDGTLALVEIVFGQLHRQKNELRELHALAAQPSNLIAPGDPGEITPAMLAGAYGG